MKRDKKDRQLTRLGELISIKHGWPFRSQHFSDYQQGRPIVVNIGNFQYTGGFRFESTAIKAYIGEYPKEYILKPGDILLVMTCQTAGGEILGIPGRIPHDERQYLHNQRMGKVVVLDKNRVDQDFLYWLFLTFDFNHHLVATASGAKILHTAPSRIESYQFQLPPLSTQRKIATILSAYDDLIENNTRRIAILEEMAQSLYREWFVHFRFPGYEKKCMVESALGMIPEGWEVVKLGEFCFITMGQSPSSEFYNTSGDGLPFHQGVADFGERFPKDRVYCTATNRIAEAADILFSVRAPVGRINLANKKIVIGRGVSSIRSKTGNQCFVFQQLKEIFQEEDIIGNGAIFKAVTKEDMHGIKMLRPPQPIIMSFEQQIQPIFSNLEVLFRKNANLRQTRDLLLPKLISGEVDVEGLEIAGVAGG